VDCMHLAKERDKWQAFVSTVMNFRLPKSSDNVLSGLFGHESIIISSARGQPMNIERASFWKIWGRTMDP
jgi:hypothetical protein